jgi:uncharacterized protein YlxP (DUF503 family)
MIVGVLRVDLLVPEARSLKDKRRVVQSIKQRLRNQHNVSVSEVEYEEIHQRCALGISMVANESRFVQSCLDRLVDGFRADPRVSLLDYEQVTY